MNPVIKGGDGYICVVEDVIIHHKGGAVMRIYHSHTERMGGC